MIAYFVLPAAVGISLSSFWTGALTLGLCSAAYVSEIIRSAINALPAGQWEASEALGYTYWAQIRFIIGPQALRTALGPLINETMLVLKSTALIATIGVVELTKAGVNTIARSLDPFLPCLTLALIYLGLSCIAAQAGAYLERKLS
jgi:ABC-type amino acid transport system permease subunit